MDTLDRRVQGLLPAAENFYTPPGSAKVFVVTINIYFISEKDTSGIW